MQQVFKIIIGKIKTLKKRIESRSQKISNRILNVKKPISYDGIGAQDTIIQILRFAKKEIQRMRRVAHEYQLELQKKHSVSLKDQ